MRYVPLCDGTLTDLGNGTVSCSGTWLTTIDASPIPGAFDLSLLDPALVMNYFGAGFGIVGACALLGICVGAILHMIRGKRP